MRLSILYEARASSSRKGGLENPFHRWEEVLATYPKDLQDEFRDERPNPNEEDVREAERYTLKSKTPVTVNITDLLKNSENLGSISRCPTEVVDAINLKWGLSVKPGKVYDQRPERYFQYAKMPSATAKPSVMFNGSIEWGVGRFIAALLRGEKTLKVWDLRTTD